MLVVADLAAYDPSFKKTAQGLAAENERLTTENLALQEEIKRLKQLVEELQQKIRNLEESLNQKEHVIAEAHTTIQQLTTTVQQLTKDNEGLNGTIKKLQLAETARLALASGVGGLLGKIIQGTANSDEIKKLQNEIAASKAELATTKEALNASKASLVEKGQVLAKASPHKLSVQLPPSNTNLEKEEEELTKTRAELEEARLTIAHQEETLASLPQTSTTLPELPSSEDREKNEAIARENDQLRTQLASATRALNDLSGKSFEDKNLQSKAYTDLLHNYNQLLNTANKLDANLQHAQGQAHAVQSLETEYNLLKNKYAHLEQELAQATRNNALKNSFNSERQANSALQQDYAKLEQAFQKLKNEHAQQTALLNSLSRQNQLQAHVQGQARATQGLETEYNLLKNKYARLEQELANTRSNQALMSHQTALHQTSERQANSNLQQDYTKLEQAFQKLKDEHAQQTALLNSLSRQNQLQAHDYAGQQFNTKANLSDLEQRYRALENNYAQTRAELESAQQQLALNQANLAYKRNDFNTRPPQVSNTAATNSSLSSLQAQYDALNAKHTAIVVELQRTRDQLALREEELARKTAEQAASSIKPRVIADEAARVEALHGKEKTLAINAQNILERLIRVRRTMEQLEALSAKVAGDKSLAIALPEK